MFFGRIITSPRNNLSPQKALDLAKVYLEVALKIEDKDLALVLCYDTEISLSQAKRAAKHKGDHAVVKEAAVTYINLGKFLASRGHSNEAKVSYKKAEKLGVNVHDPVQPTRVSHLGSTLDPPLDIRLSTEASQTSSIVNISQVSGSVHASLDHHEQRHGTVDIPADIFAANVRPPSVEYKLPGPDERLVNTHQLAACLYLLQANLSPDDILDPTVDNWLQSTKNDADEQERLTTMATEVIRAFKRDEIKDAKVVSEVVYLAPVLNDEAFRDLLSEFYSGIDHSGLLKVHQLEGLAQLIQNVDQSHLNADDLVKILGHLSERLKDTHKQATGHVYQLVLAVSYVLDAMADTKVKGLDRDKLHEPLSSYLDKLKNSSDPYFVYQAAYASQALLLVPDKETTWQAFMRRSGKVIQGVSGLMKAAKGLDLDRCKKELNDIQKNLGGASKVIELVKGVYDDATLLVVSGKGLWDTLKKGLSFEHKRDWYSALRAADALIRDGDLTTFRKLVCEAPCRLDPAFQWGVCQRLGEIAANPLLDTDNRRSAVAFLGEIYRNDEVWGQEASVKKWILNILMQLTSTSGTGSQRK
ncbi:hypothetical protein BGX34_009253 [Mortierella sp. NVP85]|nr:hypothetical protein BGX34_009253 [Mortierella sp. NVP85]